MKHTMKYTFTLLSGCMLIVTSSCTNSAVFAPEKLLADPNGANIFLVDNSGNKLVKFDRNTRKQSGALQLSEAVNNLAAAADGNVWVLTGNANGKLIKVNPNSMKEEGSLPLGYTPSAVCEVGNSNVVWVAQRHNNEVWKIEGAANPAAAKVATKVTVGREPIGLLPYADDAKILVLNNLPEEAATQFPTASTLDILDTQNGKVMGRIALPNGTTDVKDGVVDKQGDYAYVVHLIARYQLPTNQLDRGWMMTNAMSVIDLRGDSLLTTVLLDTPQRGAANPNDIAISPDNNMLFVALAGTHEVCAIDRNAMHERIEASREGKHLVPSLKSFDDIPNDAGFLHGIRAFYPTGGKGTRGVEAAANGVYVADYFSGEFKCMALDGSETEVLLSGTPLTETTVGKGDLYFHDATIAFQAWQSCASCHPNGARVDGLNWDLLNDGMGNPKNTKSLLLAHATPPCMITGIRKDAFVAVRSGIKYILFSNAAESYGNEVDAYLQNLQPLPSPYLVDGGLSEKALRGKEHFDKNCAACHNGAYYTDGKQYAVSWNDGADKEKAMDVPVLVEVWRTAPYLYDGRAATMDEVLQIHGPAEKLSNDQLSELSEYVLSL